MREDELATTRGLLVLVTGVGRSGTSLMAGVLHQVGLHVPGPFLGANDSNPKGFFESRWAVRFHNRLVESAGVYIFDARPDAWGRVQAAVGDADREQLRTFLAEQSVDADQVVVKDPRTAWTQRLWRDEAAAVGLDIGYVMMLRHPVEVAWSRSTHYAKGADDRQQRAHRLASVTRWIAHTLMSERETRGAARAFVRYNDVVADWRAVLSDLEGRIGLRVDAGASAADLADEFVDPGLHRQRATWADLDAPEALADLAEQVWTTVQLLVDDPGHEGAQATLDACADGYRRLVADWAAATHDWAAAASHAATAAAAEVPVPRAVPAPAALPVQERAVRDVRAGELARVLVSRVAARLRR